MMRFLLALGCCGLYASASVAKESAVLAKHVKASLVFREARNGEKRFGYPRVLLVYLRLENQADSDVWWYANSVENIEEELLDAKGKPVETGPSAASMMSNAWTYRLPYGSSLDWLISHGGVSMMEERKNRYALIVGGQGWLLPVDSVGTYSLRIQLRGVPYARDEPKETEARQLLMEVPATPIRISK